MGMHFLMSYSIGDDRSLVLHSGWPQLLRGVPHLTLFSIWFNFPQDQNGFFESSTTSGGIFTMFNCAFLLELEVDNVKNNVVPVLPMQRLNNPWILQESHWEFRECHALILAQNNCQNASKKTSFWHSWQSQRQWALVNTDNKSHMTHNGHTTSQWTHDFTMIHSPDHFQIRFSEHNQISH